MAQHVWWAGISWCRHAVRSSEYLGNDCNRRLMAEKRNAGSDCWARLAWQQSGRFLFVCRQFGAKGLTGFSPRSNLHAVFQQNDIKLRQQAAFGNLVVA